MRLRYFLDERTVKVRFKNLDAAIKVQRIELPRYTGPFPSSTWRNKPVVGPPERPFAELRIVADLETRGWAAAWVYRPGKFLSSWEPRRFTELPANALAVHRRIEQQSGAHAGCWDVFGWRDGRALFVELKRAGSSDRIRAPQLRWREAALAVGVPEAAFVIVEWSIGRGAKAALARRRRAAGRKAAATRKRRPAARMATRRDDARTDMRDVMASPALIPKVLSGKYSKWAKRLDTDSLDAALRAVGEFGGRYWAMKSLDGRFPAPVFQPHAMAEDRMVYALESFAILRGTGRYEFEGFHGWGGEFSPSSPAFSREYRDHLSLDPSTSWARDLDEQSFFWMIWMIGEYGIRVATPSGAVQAPPTEDQGTYATPNFDGPAEQTQPMRAALSLIAMIYRGA